MSIEDTNAGTAALHEKGSWGVGPDGMFTLSYDPEKAPYDVRIDWQGLCYVDMTIEGDDYDIVLGDIDIPMMAESLFEEDLLESMNCYKPFLVLEKVSGTVKEFLFGSEEKARDFAQRNPHRDLYLMKVDGSFYSGGKNYDFGTKL